MEEINIQAFLSDSFQWCTQKGDLLKTPSYLWILVSRYSKNLIPPLSMRHYVVPYFALPLLDVFHSPSKDHMILSNNNKPTILGPFFTVEQADCGFEEDWSTPKEAFAIAVAAGTVRVCRAQEDDAVSSKAEDTATTAGLGEEGIAIMLGFSILLRFLVEESGSMQLLI